MKLFALTSLLLLLIQENLCVPIPTSGQTDNIENKAITVKAESDVKNSGTVAGKPFSYQYSVVNPHYTPTFYQISPQILPLGYFNAHQLYFQPYRPVVLLNPAHQWVIQHPQTVQPDASQGAAADQPTTPNENTLALEITPPKESENEIPVPPITEVKEKSLIEGEDDSVVVSKDFDEEGLVPEEKNSDDVLPLAKKSDNEDDKTLLDAVEFEGQDIVPNYDEE